MDVAETRETSCSAERPPKIRATFIFLGFNFYQGNKEFYFKGL